MTNGKFVKGQPAWNKGIKMPEMAAKIDKEQRSRQLKERWSNKEPALVSGLQSAIIASRSPRSETYKENLRVRRLKELATHPENCDCFLHSKHKSPKAVANMAAFFRGRKLTEEHKQKISAGYKNHPENCKCASHTAYWTNGAPHPIISKPQLAFAKLLTSVGIEIELEKSFGKYSVDIYLPKSHIAIEIDGDYWHNLPKMKSHDKSKDYYLRTVHNLIVIRVWESEVNRVKSL